MATLWPSIIVAIALWLVFRFVRSQFRAQEPSSPMPGGRGDPLSGVRSPKKNTPGGRTGAIALAEPDEDDDDGNHTYPPWVG